MTESKDILEGSRQIRELLIKALIVATGASEDEIREAPLTISLKFREGLKNGRSDLEDRILEYANDLRRNSSGGDDYPWEIMKGVADYLEVLIGRAALAATPSVIDRKMIETVIGEFAIDNRELSYLEMEPEEFSRRIMEKIKAKPSATPAVGGDALEWAVEWHRCVETMMTMAGLSSAGSPSESLAEFQEWLALPASPLRGRAALAPRLLERADSWIKDNGRDDIYTCNLINDLSSLVRAFSASPPEQPVEGKRS